MRLINKAIWKDQPAGREVGGDEKSIDRITISNIKEFHRNHYTPNNTVISVAGAGTTNRQQSSGRGAIADPAYTK